MSLQKQGFRFVRRNGGFRWVHKNELVQSDLDCTDMSDAQFESAVREVSA